tara:strand:+ start:82 stop:300 length:219 start_codon:yes stop_codon:yes gene_type:complete
MVRSLREEAGPTMSVGANGYTGKADDAGPTAGYDPVISLIDRRKRRFRSYPKEYLQMVKDDKKGNRLKSVMK